MAGGRLANLMKSAFERTPPKRAREIFHLLDFSLPANVKGSGVRHVYDPTCGEGDLLEPAINLGSALNIRLFGVEIAENRAEESRRRLPGATIITSAVESVSVPKKSQCLVLANPPYYLLDRKVVAGQEVSQPVRAELSITRRAGEALIPGGIMVDVIPARSAWKGDMINHWSRFYTNIRCYKFPDEDQMDLATGTTEDEKNATFDAFSQIVVIGVRRASPLEKPDPQEQERLSKWRWHEPKHAGASPWGDNDPPPPVLPSSPLPLDDRFWVPNLPAGTPAPKFTVWRADDETLLRALHESGVQKTDGWLSATQWEERSLIDEPAMPITGIAHLAAVLLTGIMDGKIVEGPDGDCYIFTSFVTQRWVDVQLEEEFIEEQRKKGVIGISVRQQEDHAVLGVLNLTKKEMRYFQGEQVYSFLEPWLPILAQKVFAEYTPVYNLDPSMEEVEIVANIGVDKQLPGAEPGLDESQMHRVFAMNRVLDEKKQVAIQGEPGTGKTRQDIALMALKADDWRRREEDEAQGKSLKPWMQGYRRAWYNNPRTLTILEQRGNSRSAFLAAVAATSPTETVLAQVEMEDLQCCDITTGLHLYREKRGLSDAHCCDVQTHWPLYYDAQGHLVTGIITPESRSTSDGGSGRTQRRVAVSHPKLLEPRAPGFLVSAPRRTLLGWLKEINGAWPEAEVVLIEDHLDVLIWVERCAETSAPAVIALVPHSLSRAFGREWVPSVHETELQVTVPDLEPTEDQLDEYEPVYGYGDEGEKEVIEYRSTQTGEVLTKTATVTAYRCPDCNGLLHASRESDVPAERQGLRSENEEDSLRVVASATYFQRRPRWCNCVREDYDEEGRPISRATLAWLQTKFAVDSANLTETVDEADAPVGPDDGLETVIRCRAALWTDARVAETQKKFPGVTYREWVKVMTVLHAFPSVSPDLLEKLPLHAMVKALASRLSCAEDSPQAKSEKQVRLRNQVVLSKEERARRERRALFPIPAKTRLSPLSKQEAERLVTLVAKERHLSQQERLTLELYQAQEHMQVSRVLHCETVPLTLIAVVEPLTHVPDGYTEVRETVDGHDDVLVAYVSPDGKIIRPVWSERRKILTKHTRPVHLIYEDTKEVLLGTAYYRFIAPPPDSFSPYKFLYDSFRGCVVISTIDESHNARARNTDIARSVHYAQLAAQRYVYASGTHYGGALKDFFYYWFRFNPEFWLRLGFTWKDADRVNTTYGVIQHWVREYESDARRGSGQTDIRESTIPAPGISARLIPYLIAWIVYIGILDVGMFMPPRLEFPEIVPMSDPLIKEPVEAARLAEEDARAWLNFCLQQEKEIQERITIEGEIEELGEELASACQGTELARLRLEEAQVALQEKDAWASLRDLEESYRDATGTLEFFAKKRNGAARMAQGTIPKWYSILPFDPPFELWSTERDEWGDVKEKKCLLRTAILSRDHHYPLERRLVEIVEKELAEGRRCMIYVEQSDLRSTAQRLKWVLQERGIDPWIMPGNTKAEKREDAIRTAIRDKAHQVVIVGYRLVSEGLNLQDVVDTIIWYEMAMNLFSLDQASRRAWRLGKSNEVRIYYLVYAGTAAYRKLRNLGQRGGAAAAFSGEPAQGALIDASGANKTMLARLSHSLSAWHGKSEAERLQEEEEQIKANFARRNEELKATMKKGRTFIGVEDRILPMLLKFVRDKQQLQQSKVGEVEQLEEQSTIVEAEQPEHLAASILNMPESFSELPTAMPTNGDASSEATHREQEGVEVDDIDHQAALKSPMTWDEARQEARRRAETILQEKEAEKKRRREERKLKQKQEREARKQAKAPATESEEKHPFSPTPQPLTLFDLLSTDTDAHKQVFQRAFEW